MKVRDLLGAWAWADCGDTKICVGTSGNPYGEDLKWVGGFRDVEDSGYAGAVVIGFADDCVDGVHRIGITVDAHSVPVRVLRGWN